MAASDSRIHILLPAARSAAIIEPRSSDSPATTPSSAATHAAPDPPWLVRKRLPSPPALRS